jgi:3-oxoacyl-[acyl-carrier-protein] synthase-3
MAGSTIAGMAVKGIAAAVPKQLETVQDLARIFGEQDSAKIAQITGVSTRHIASPAQCTSDLCCAAADTLLKHLKWDPASVDALLFVSQTFDYILPATSCTLHERLCLSKGCAAFDISLGCSGYIYGLWVASSLVVTGCRRILLLAGDVSSKTTGVRDRSTRPLFGDAGTATAIEADEQGIVHFELGTDGTGHRHLIIPAGLFRNPHSSGTSVATERENGNVRSDEVLYMNGAEIFTFTLREVPPLLTRILERSGWPKTEIDAFVFHQANKYMLDYLAKRMQITPDKMPLSLEHFGNTSSASIPLTITQSLKGDLETGRKRLILAGFGVGFSWGAAALDIGPLAIPELQVVP